MHDPHYLNEIEWASIVYSGPVALPGVTEAFLSFTNLSIIRSNFHDSDIARKKISGEYLWQALCRVRQKSMQFLYIEIVILLILSHDAK